MTPEDKTGGDYKEGRLMGTGRLPHRGYLRDAVQLFNERTNSYEAGWEHRFNKRAFKRFFALQNFSSATEQYSDSFFCAPYRNALILMDIRDTTGTPTTLLLEVYFSWDDVQWFKYMRDFYGMLEWEDTAMPVMESFDIPILAPYIRFGITVVGGDSSNYFPAELEAIFNGV